MSFSTSLTGLNAAQTELSATSNNIANVGTIGFKKSRVEFGDIVTRSVTEASNRVAGVGVATYAVKQQFGQGSYENSTNALDLSISGQGFFMVQGENPQTSSLTLTRNGAFHVDPDGNWVIDNSGRRLQVLPTTVDGKVTATGVAALQPLQLPTESGPPAGTTAVEMTINLPASATSPTVPFDRNDATSFNHATSETVYDILGNGSTMTLYYRHIDSPPADTNKYWEVYAFQDDLPIAPTSGPNPPVLTFDAAGVLDPATAPLAYDSGYTINHGGSAIMATPFNVAFSTQDGYAPGRLESVGVDLEGVVRVSFSNGETRALGKLALGNVANVLGLKQDGNASWLIGPSSGPLQIGEAGANGYGYVSSGSLEGSNVDLTEELVNLIKAQRNFQANARAIDTASALLQTIVQLRS